jgi:hypothetical protein
MAESSTSCYPSAPGGSSSPLYEGFGRTRVIGSNEGDQRADRTNGVRSIQPAATVTTSPLGRCGCPVWRFIGIGNGSRG